MLVPQERLIPPALSLPRKIGCAVAAGILDKCHSFFYFLFLLIGDILLFLLLLRLLILAMQLEPVNSFVEKWKRYNKQTMCQPQSTATETVLLTFFTNEGGGTFTNIPASNRASLHLVNVLLRETSHIFLPSSSKKLSLPLLKHMLVRNEPSKEWDIPKSGCS